MAQRYIGECRPTDLVVGPIVSRPTGPTRNHLFQGQAISSVLGIVPTTGRTVLQLPVLAPTSM